MKVSVCVLCYGDYPALAERCLGSLRDFMDWSLVRDLRIGLNGVSPQTQQKVVECCRGLPVPVYLVERPGGQTHPPYCKYPMMRRMFSGTIEPLADVVMWLDDDSYLIAESTLRWKSLVNTFSAELLVVQVGEVWRWTPNANQLAAYKAQPWYTGKSPTGAKGDFLFITGGWWLAPSSFLRRWDYPFPVLKHNGGDTALGALMVQQNHPILGFRGVVVVNQEKRRGLAQRPLWSDYQPGQVVDLSHHNFEVKITRLEPTSC